MPILLEDVFGSPNIGVYAFCNEKLVIVPPGLTEKKIQRFRDNLGVEVCVTSIGGSSLLGVLIAANSNGLVLPHFVRDFEVEKIRARTDLRVEVLEERLTAFGNLVLANDNGAVVHPDVPLSLRRTLRDVLDVEVTSGHIAGLPVVGALAVVNKMGAIVHPAIMDSEKSVIENTLGVEANAGTINGGVPFVRSGLLANSKGAVAGPLTRGPELMELTRTLRIV
jgi:translation initiation factor 6